MGYITDKPEPFSGIADEFQSSFELMGYITNEGFIICGKVKEGFKALSSLWVI